MTKGSKLDRRTFLSGATIASVSGVLGAGGLLTACSGSGNRITPLRSANEIYIPELTDKAIDGRPIRAALIGCGGRGTGAAFNFLEAGDGLSIVACADVFQDKIDNCCDMLKERVNNEVAADKRFLGFDAYKKVCELPEVDIILIASPSIFHPEQLRYAIEQGKHAFCEKAAAIDAVGYRTFMTAVRQAQSRGVNIITGTQRHHHRGYVESYKKVQEGYIGRIVGGNVYYMQGHLTPVRRRPEWTDMEFMLRDIFHWNWITGDHVIDQMVHLVDLFTWFSHLKPESALGFGSRLRRIGGDIYDNFSVDFKFEGDVHLHAMARQINSCHNQVSERIQGTKGVWHSTGYGSDFFITDLDGNEIWRYDKVVAQEEFEQHNPYTLEHVDLVNHIRSNKVTNHAEITAISSMACIMARESAYTGRLITWDEMIQSDLNLLPDELDMGNVDMSKYIPPLPGTSPNMPNV